MKICIVSDLYYPHPGGVSEHIYHTYCELKKLGHEVKILTAHYGRAKDERDVIKVGRGLLFPINKSFGSIIIGTGVAAKVKYVIREGNFDVIHAHGPHAFLPCVAFKHSNSVNIMTFHASAPDRKWHRYFARLIREYINKIDATIAVSNLAKETMTRHIPCENTIIPNGVDTDRFSPSVKGYERFQDGKFNILFIGRLEPRKGLKYLLQAFTIICKEIPDVRLIVVGKGPLENYHKGFIKSKIRDKISFEGFVPADAVPRYYASCDVYCSPAIGRESFGIVLLEAMSSQKPIVASNIGGYREVVKDGYDGIFVEPEDPKALAFAIVKLLKDSNLREKLAKNGRQKALTYSWEKVTKDIVNFYQKILDKKR